MELHISAGTHALRYCCKDMQPCCCTVANAAALPAHSVQRELPLHTQQQHWHGCMELVAAWSNCVCMCVAQSLLKACLCLSPKRAAVRVCSCRVDALVGVGARVLCLQANYSMLVLFSCVDGCWLRWCVRLYAAAPTSQGMWSGWRLAACAGPLQGLRCTCKCSRLLHACAVSCCTQVLCDVTCDVGRCGATAHSPTDL